MPSVIDAASRFHATREVAGTVERRPPQPAQPAACGTLLSDLPHQTNPALELLSCSSGRDPIFDPSRMRVEGKFVATPQQARQIAQTEAIPTAVFSAVTSTIPMGQYLSRVAPGVLNRYMPAVVQRLSSTRAGQALVSAAAEGSQEAAEQVFQQTMAAIARDDPDQYRDLAANVGVSFLGGAALGARTDLTLGALASRSRPQPAPQNPEGASGVPSVQRPQNAEGEVALPPALGVAPERGNAENVGASDIAALVAEAGQLGIDARGKPLAALRDEVLKARRERLDPLPRPAGTAAVGDPAIQDAGDGEIGGEPAAVAGSAGVVGGSRGVRQ